MFNTQPGQGLGCTGSKQIALGLGTSCVTIEAPEVEQPQNIGGGTWPGIGDKKKKRKDQEKAIIMAVIKEFLEREG